MSLPRALARTVLDALFPPRCVVCRAPGAVLRATCLNIARAPALPFFPRCGRPADDRLTGSPLASAAPSGVCVLCASGQEPKALAAVRVAAVYEGDIRQAMLTLKFRGQRRVAEPLGELLAAEVHRADWRPDVIVPVPLHGSRVRQRGYNQTELLARACARRLGVPCRQDLVVRRCATPPQVGLSAAARRANVADAFALAAPSSGAHPLAGKRVLVVNDVTTTGSTLDAAAAALLSAAPAAVWGLAVTRPDLHSDNAQGRQRPLARLAAVPQQEGQGVP